LLISDLKEYVGSLQSSNSYNPHFKEYIIQEGEEGLVLVGYGQTQKKPATFHRPDLLFNMVSIVKSSLPEFFDDDFLVEVIDNKKIIKFCKVYGMPVDSASVELKHLRYKIAWLKSRYLVWFALFNYNNKGNFRENHDSEAELKKYVESRRLAEKLDSKAAAMLGGDTEERAKVMLGHEVSMNLNNLGVLSLYNMENQAFQITLSAKNLFDVAYFQLANLLTMDKKYIKQHLKQCNNTIDCGQLFWALHGHSKYCAYCDRRVVHAKKNKGGRKKHVEEEKRQG
jgi:hypothetical protein